MTMALGGAPDPAEGPPNRAWRDGPVRYLLSDSEYKRYGRLKSEDSRAAFVERFWYRLDPYPDTKANEFRETFRARCREAEARFSDSRGPGWRSDRGRVYLALGEPETMERLPGDPRSIGRDVWTYTTPASGNPIRVIFYRGTDGIYRLDPRNAERVDPFDPDDRKALVERFRDSNPGLGRIRSANIVSGYLFQILVRDSASEGVSPWAGVDAGRRDDPGTGGMAEEPALGRLLEDVFYFQAVDGSVLAMLTLEVVSDENRRAEGEIPPYTAVAHVSASADVAVGGAQRTVTLSPFPAEIAREKQLFVGRVYLEPGTSQRIRYVVTDSSRNTLLLRTATLRAPELGSGTLSASSLVPAERFGPAPADGSRFAVGSEEVVPRPSAAFRQGEPLRLYLQVYDATVHARTYQYDVNLEFEFQRYNGRRWKRHGKKLHVRGAYGASLGLALPIGDWPPGDYRAEVILEDKLTGIRTETGARFTVTD